MRGSAFLPWKLDYGHSCLAANSSSLPEVLGDAAVYFRPFDSVELAEYIHALLRCEGKRRLMGEQGLARAKEFSWQRNAEETVAFGVALWR